MEDLWCNFSGGLDYDSMKWSDLISRIKVDFKRTLKMGSPFRIVVLCKDFERQLDNILKRNITFEMLWTIGNMLIKHFENDLFSFFI